MAVNLIPLKNSLTHNIVTKVIAFIIGYGIWCAISNLHTHDRWISVPLCFYGQHATDDVVINAPESILIHIAGKRSALQAIDLEHIALHINTTSLQNGVNPICVDAQNLFLPNTINVLDYTPAPLVITITTHNLHPLPSEPLYDKTDTIVS